VLFDVATSGSVVPFCLEYDVVDIIYAYDSHIFTLDVLKALEYLLPGIIFATIHANATYECYATFHNFVMRQAIKIHAARVSLSVDLSGVIFPKWCISLL